MIRVPVDLVLNTRNVMASRVLSLITNNFVTVYRQANKVCINP
jgi:hypothetical protein